MAAIPARGLTNVAFPLQVAARELARIPARDARVLLLSDCVHNAGPDPRPLAARLPRIDVLLDATGEQDRWLGGELARLGRGKFRVAASYRDVAPALSSFFAELGVRYGHRHRRHRDARPRVPRRGDRSLRGGRGGGPPVRGRVPALRAARGAGRQAGDDREVRRPGGRGRAPEGRRARRSQRRDQGQAGRADGHSAARAAHGRVARQGRALTKFQPARAGRCYGNAAKVSEEAMANKWFETVAVAQRRAKRRLPASVYGALIAGAEAGVTIRDNVNAFTELGFAPHVAGLPAPRDMATTVMGQPISLPVLISPPGVQAGPPDGEVAVARAAAARGTAMGLSSFASKPIEEVIAANPKTFFQMYWVGGRDEMLARMDRARAAGAVGIIVTLDWSFSFGRDWGSPRIPEKMTLQEMMRQAPSVVTRPSYLYQWLRNGEIPDLTVPNLPVNGAPAPTFFGAYGQWMGSAPPSWEDVAWLRSQWDGPFMLKGVTRIDDAKRAVDAGVSAISVSNHGGNNLDGTPPPIRLLADIARAGGEQGGGVRRGSDVVKALALGARAVMIGRAYLWGLGANGQAGVENVLDLMRSGIDACLLGLGHSSISELTPDDLVIPPGFTRRLGG